MAICDGLDGAAARRFGGTRFGVLADDVADAISYGVAPAIAVAIATSGIEGTAVGVVYGTLTLTRLVFFTLRKGLPGDDRRNADEHGDADGDAASPEVERVGAGGVLARQGDAADGGHGRLLRFFVPAAVRA